MKKHIAVIGGGTGTFVALTGLKEYPVELSAVVTMMDSGGSTGRLRDQLGVLPPGDIRQALVALSESDEIWRNLFVYRFGNGDLEGHNFGNIFLSALEKMTGSFKKALEIASELLQVNGSIVPVTYDNSQLCVELANGRIIEGETHIDQPLEKERPIIKRAFLRPKVKANRKAVQTMQEADLIIIGPGDLYTSLLVNLLVDGVAEAIRNSKGKVVYIVNLMTKFGQTTDYSAVEHIRDLEKYLGGGVLDCVCVNTRKPDSEALEWYRRQREIPVLNDIEKSAPFQVIEKDLLSSAKINAQAKDRIRRSFIRHDPAKLAKAVISLL